MAEPLIQNSTDFSITPNMEREVDYIKHLGREAVKQIVFNMFRFAVLCTKHPGFHEEREWRVVASPAMHPTNHATLGVEVIHGTPQTVLKLNLQNHKEKGLVGLAIPELLNRIIIGPCEFPQIISSAFHRLLQKLGYQNLKKRSSFLTFPLGIHRETQSCAGNHFVKRAEIWFV